MKIAIVVAALLALIAPASLACQPNEIAYEGLCAADPRPAVAEVESVKPSDEKPRRGRQSAWETGEVNAEVTKTKSQHIDEMIEKIANDGVPARVKK